MISLQGMEEKETKLNLDYLLEDIKKAQRDRQRLKLCVCVCVWEREKEIETMKKTGGKQN